MWKLVLMNRFAVTRLEGVFITNVAGVVSEWQKRVVSCFWSCLFTLWLSDCWI